MSPPCACYIIAVSFCLLKVVKIMSSSADITWKEFVWKLLWLFYHCEYVWGIDFCNWSSCKRIIRDHKKKSLIRDEIKKLQRALFKCRFIFQPFLALIIVRRRLQIQNKQQNNNIVLNDVTRSTLHRTLASTNWNTNECECGEKDFTRSSTCWIEYIKLAQQYIFLVILLSDIKQSERAAATCGVKKKFISVIKVKLKRNFICWKQ